MEVKYASTPLKTFSVQEQADFMQHAVKHSVGWEHWFTGNGFRSAGADWIHPDECGDDTDDQSGSGDDNSHPSVCRSRLASCKYSAASRFAGAPGCMGHLAGCAKEQVQVPQVELK